ncbi:MAG TPA: dephospho-CoA kinase [Nitrospiraceae bacterium]|jgi:dephospho-CoA kinase|nr:dephospho-CoA kinase [Nitrospiraceae bacterium]
MVLVGLTGGLATGKSTVAALFKRCGAYVVDADVLARQVVAPGTAGWRAVVTAFGKGVLNSDRTINRQTLGSIIFRHPAKRRQLERIIHPRVSREQARLTKQAAAKNPRAVVLYDVPLLFEAGLEKVADKVVVVAADRETQIARLRERNGLSRSEAVRRIRSQMPLRKKIRRADYVLDGTLARAKLLTQVKQLYRDLRLLA